MAEPIPTPEPPVKPLTYGGHECHDYSPAWFTGRWRDWHRGHGCRLDDGKPRTDEGQKEIDAHVG